MWGSAYTYFKLLIQFASVPQPVQLWLNVVVAEGDKDDDDDDFISTPRSRLLGKRAGNHQAA